MNTEIRINRSLLLEQYFDLPNNAIDKVIEEYRKVWIQRESFIIQKIEEVTGLICKRNLIDAYIVDGKRTDAISSPIIIGAGNDPEDFVRILPKMDYSSQWIDEELALYNTVNKALPSYDYHAKRIATNQMEKLLDVISKIRTV